MVSATPNGPITNEREVNLIHPYLDNHQNLNIADLGCRECEMISNLYNRFHVKIRSINGVDNDEDLDLDEERFTNFRNDIEGNVYMPVELIKFHPKDVIEYLKENSTLQDLVIMGNFLHFFELEKKIEILNLVLSRLSDNGVIYVMVGNENHREVDFPMTQHEWSFIKDNVKIQVSFEQELPKGFLEIILKHKK